MPREPLPHDHDIDVHDTAHAEVIAIVGGDRDVLDLGGASGHVGRALRERGCRVTGVESDPEAAKRAEATYERVVVGDLDELDLAIELEGNSFDVVVAAGILEHVKDPGRVLAQVASLLRPDGFVVAVVPNLAHASVRLSVLAGRLGPTHRGLRDGTQLSFFTKETLYEQFERAGYLVTDLDRTFRPIDDGTCDIDTEALPPGVAAWVMADEEATTDLFIAVAVPAGAVPERVHQLVAWLRDSPAPERVHLPELFERHRKLEAELSAREAELDALGAEIEPLRASLSEAELRALEARDELAHQLALTEEIAAKLRLTEKRLTERGALLRRIYATRVWRNATRWWTVKRRVLGDP